MNCEYSMCSGDTEPWTQSMASGDSEQKLMWLITMNSEHGAQVTRNHEHRTWAEVTRYHELRSWLRWLRNMNSAHGLRWLGIMNTEHGLRWLRKWTKTQVTKNMVSGDSVTWLRTWAQVTPNLNSGDSGHGLTWLTFVSISLVPLVRGVCWLRTLMVPAVAACHWQPAVGWLVVTQGVSLGCPPPYPHLHSTAGCVCRVYTSIGFFAPCALCR